LLNALAYYGRENNKSEDGIATQKCAALTVVAAGKQRSLELSLEHGQ